MQDLIIYSFGNNAIRIQQDRDDQPWFNAQDVCAALEFGNPRQALDSHIDEDDVQKLDIIDELGRKQRANFVNARDLHQFLEVHKDFSTWIKQRIEKYGFEEGKDYLHLIPPNGGIKKHGGDRHLDGEKRHGR